MRLVPLLSAALILSVSEPASTQGVAWTEYVSRADFFSVSFPGEPKVQEITYPTEYRITLPGRVYTYVDGANRYSVTVIDYRDAEKIHQERVKRCIAAGCDGDTVQPNAWRSDVHGALVYASWNIMKRDAKLTHYAMYDSDVIEGHEIHLTNADRSRTFAVVHMHENRLYMLEATVPPGAPAPGLFQISLRFLDKELKPVRYQWVGSGPYSNGYPAPPRAGRGQGAGQGGGRGQQN